MANADMSVFVCYCRSDLLRALAVSQNLSRQGYDVYFDHSDSNEREVINFEQIRKRFHFLILLTPTALASIADVNNPMWREIEIALNMQHDIVLLFYEGANLGLTTGKLEALKQYPFIEMVDGHFDKDMGYLCKKYLGKARKTDHTIAGIETSVESNTANLSDFVENVEIGEIKPLALDWYQRGENANDPMEKIRCYTEAISLDPNFALAYFCRGLVFQHRNEVHLAIQDYTNAILYNPDLATAYCNRGFMRVLQGDADGALEDCNEAIRLQPRFGAAYCNRGMAYRKKEKIEKAIEDYTTAIELEPQSASAYTNRSDAYILQGKFDAAILDSTEAIRLQTDNYAAYNNRAGAYYSKGDFDNALRDLGEVIRIKPDLAKAYKTRAIIFLQDGKYEKGISDLQKYLDVGGGKQYGDQDEVEKLILNLKTKN